VPFLGRVVASRVHRLLVALSALRSAPRPRAADRRLRPRIMIGNRGGGEETRTPDPLHAKRFRPENRWREKGHAGTKMAVIVGFFVRDQGFRPLT